MSEQDNATDTGTPQIGDNVPSPAQQLREQLIEKYDPLITPRARELVKQLNALPDPLPDDRLEEASELLKSTNVHLRKVNSYRETEKEPYLEAGRTVDGYFKGGVFSELETGRDRVRPLYERAHDQRTEANRRAAEEEARKQRESAEQARREAEERARLEREKAEAAQRAADEARQKMEEDPVGVQANRAAERAMEQAIEAHKNAEAAARLAQTASHRAEAAALGEQRVQQAKPAEFARLRTDHGVVATQVEGWEFKVADYNKLPKAQLWKYLSHDAIDAAIKAAIKAGVRDIKGVQISKKNTSIIR